MNNSLIDKLVLEFQEGDKEAGENILEVFNPYLMKYCRLLHLGNINLSDRDSRRFISLFIKDPVIRKGLARGRFNFEAKMEGRDMAIYLSRICSFMSLEDIEQEVKVALLTLATRWKKKGRANFTGYMYNSFRYELYRKLELVLKNTVMFNGKSTTYNDEEYAAKEIEIEVTDTLTIITDDSLGNSWVRGLTCSDQFNALTSLQRLILKEYYDDGTPEVKIAEKLGLHFNTVRNHRLRAISLLHESNEV